MELKNREERGKTTLPKQRTKKENKLNNTGQPLQCLEYTRSITNP